ncbi:elongation factor Ts [Tenacibaculum finnmarkense genomovar finnmarkense]|uniref:Elongation factor Ts n=1 Tax=Tenacibaculum finnmarkense genomovar finnmarkense TaxID=1458503 RepID=A0AAP1WGL9_9FLAO|nr:translation elongation factor Ts [Tenacibaculum finnmarkense]MBE7653132.1 elongation factor Ts [Tenacibaculum finnmarkense genomovar finnmarkense]MBE7660152.1 elongation factor Ts [Tenacibaculum finnmarkense genomovar finnmarkense]MBE7692938.1 elongation factor Ts [Tenacibaculum finnmarkense genomovar finnmarkense]MBE7695498.1 elongation factor Ts [Tenacibaculum finnmarkense genomovar finnmarkense]MCD8403097.1 translation elongation factor Ts [Tenacibaculum finnmarkense genomovar finnmarken
MSVKISAADVKKLRETTGAGMMDCKNALVEAEGNFDKSIDILRKKGQKIAAKRADRDSTEGVAITKISDDNTYGVAIVLACETDFVSKNDSFKDLAAEFVAIAFDTKSKEEFLAADFGGVTVAEKLIEQTGVIGEKIDITSFERLEAPFVGSYTHIGKIAAMVGLSAPADNAAVLAKDLAMQAASMGAISLSYKGFDPAYVEAETEARIAVIAKDNIELGRLGKTLKNVPQYVSRLQLTDAALAQAEEVAKEQLKSEGKPEKIWDKILPGKMERFISDNTTLDQEQCLLDQKFIKDEKKTVAEYVSSFGDVEVKNFVRVTLG